MKIMVKRIVPNACSDPMGRPFWAAYTRNHMVATRPTFEEIREVCMGWTQGKIA